MGDSELLDLVEFVQRNLDLRDELSFRRLRGEELSPRESLMLGVLNRALEEITPPPDPIPEEIQDLVAEVLRR